MEKTEIRIVSQLVDEQNRLDFLPNFLGVRLMMRGETLLYSWLSKLSLSYNVAYWEFYTLSNGGFYMCPKLKLKFLIKVPGNGFLGEVSADAAGIIATLFMIGQLAAENEGKPEADSLIDRYYFLREFADGHEESSSISRAID